MPSTNSLFPWKKKGLVGSTHYELFMGSVIFANAVYIGWDVQYSLTNNMKEFDNIYIGALVFAMVYICDLAARVNAERLNFVRPGPDLWYNLFDTCVVAIMIVEQALRMFDAFQFSDGTHKSIGLLRMVRLLRLLRIVHVVRFLKFFRQFKLLAHSIQKAVNALLWVLVICGLNVYFFAVAIASGALEYCDADTRHEKACQNFGTIPSAIAVLYKAMLGGLLWGELVDDARSFGVFYQILVAFFITFSLIVIMNLVTGVLIEILNNTSRTEQETMIRQMIRSKRDYVKKMERIFREVDLNDSGGISWDEFNLALKDQRMIAFLESLGLDLSDASQVFMLLDRDQTGTIEIEEFVLGCMQMKGEARTLDIMKLQVQAEWVMHNVGYLRTRFDSLHHGSPANPGGESEDMALTSSHSGLNSPKQHSVCDTPVQHCRIENVEERSMTLKDLRKTLELVKNGVGHGWEDLETNAKFRYKEVNLYHFNYYWICPSTVPKGIELHGLKCRMVSKGQKVVQLISRAEGFVQEHTVGNCFRVRVTRGRFWGANEAGAEEYRVIVDGSDAGVPSEVRCQDGITVSHKEMMPHAKPTKPIWFCSHWWGEAIVNFVSCCEQHAHLRRIGREASYWVCAYANRQHDLAADISSDPDNSSFRKAMRAATGVLLVLDASATPFQRIWCDFELYHTLSDGKPLDIVTCAGPESEPQLLSQQTLSGETVNAKMHREEQFPLSLLAAGLHARLENGQASVEADKQRILVCMARNKKTGEQGDEAALALALDQANCTLHSYLALAAWPQAVKKGCVTDFDPSRPKTLCLSNILVQDAGMHTLHLSLSQISEVRDSNVRAVAEGLPTQLLVLRLSFEGCLQITDQGVYNLAQKLPMSLQALFLDFLGCKKITDDGVAHLANRLPPGLRELRLDFATCEKVGVPGIKALVEHLPLHLSRFYATFQGTEVDRKFSSVREIQKFVGKGSLDFSMFKWNAKSSHALDLKSSVSLDFQSGNSQASAGSRTPRGL